RCVHKMLLRGLTSRLVAIMACPRPERFRYGRLLRLQHGPGGRRPYPLWSASDWSYVCCPRPLGWRIVVRPGTDGGGSVRRATWYPCCGGDLARDAGWSLYVDRRSAIAGPQYQPRERGPGDVPK